MPKKSVQGVEPLNKDLPIYPIGVAARLLDVHPRTLRIYEDEGLIKPSRKGSRRLYSQNDIQWLACLRSAIHDQGISIPGIKKLLRYAPCYEIVECPDTVACRCDAVVDRVVPKKLRVAGDGEAARQAEQEEHEDREQQLQEKKKQLENKVKRKLRSS